MTLPSPAAARFREFFLPSAAESPSNLDYIPRGKRAEHRAGPVPGSKEMGFGKKLLEFLDGIATAQRSVKASRVAGDWRGNASGIRAVVAAQEDRVALALYRPDGLVIGVAAGELAVAELYLVDESGKPGDHPQGLLIIIGGGASLEIELRDTRCRFRDSFVR
jgi:hypothetical protein